MCFSATASFTASAFLFVVSAAGYKKIINSDQKNRVLLALLLVPFCFAIQQFSEGILWLSLLNNYGALTTNIAKYIFIFFAFIFWPAYIPSALCYLEKNIAIKWHVYIMQILTLVGFAVAAFLIYEVFMYGVSVSNMNCHILYTLDMHSSYLNKIENFLMATYLMATIMPMLISSLRGMPLMGILSTATYAVSYKFYFQHLVSVWCFFAAIVSLMIYWIVCINIKDTNLDI